MAKSGTRFFCKECGHEALRWRGQGPGGGAWNAFQEAKGAPTGVGKGSRGFKTAAAPRGPVGFGGRDAGVFPGSVGPDGKLRPVPLAEIGSAEQRRLPIEPAEVARVLGGGLVEGSVTLLGGEPGVGKSTLLTGLALWWARRGVRGATRGGRRRDRLDRQVELTVAPALPHERGVGGRDGGIVRLGLGRRRLGRRVGAFGRGRLAHPVTVRRDAPRRRSRGPAPIGCRPCLVPAATTRPRRSRSRSW